MARGVEAQRRYNIIRCERRQEKKKAQIAAREQKKLERALREMKEAANNPPLITEVSSIPISLPRDAGKY